MAVKSSPSLLSQLAVTTLAYAVAVALTALCVVPAILAPLPLTAFAPKAPLVVARTPLPEFRP